jgi:hypothetical protein
MGRRLPKEPKGKVHEKREYDAQDDHGGNGGVYPDILSFVDEIARKGAQVHDTTEQEDKPSEQGESKAQIDQSSSEGVCCHDPRHVVGEMCFAFNRMSPSAFVVTL